jgi:hypothetical protein
MRRFFLAAIAALNLSVGAASSAQGADAPGSISGRVTSLNVKGRGPNSAQLLFTIAPKGGAPRPFVALSDAEPQVFAAMANVLTLALGSGRVVSVSFVAAHPTPIAYEIEIRR